jgi:hypothetical protein
MAKLNRVDVAMLPYFAFEAGIPPLVELVKRRRARSMSFTALPCASTLHRKR